MILRNGVDLIEIDRFESAFKRHGTRLLNRVFTENEISDAKGRIESLAVRFAAKEAVSKALGTGIGKVAWCEIEIIKGQDQEPILKLHGNAQQLAIELGIETWSISLTHTRELALAFVVATGFNSK